MNVLLFLLADESSGQVEQIARTFGVDWSHLMAQVISFSIVCTLLYLFAYKPMLKMLATRRELIAQGLANSEKIKAELAKTEQQRQEVLARANTQATQFIEEARDAAVHLREQEKPQRPPRLPNKSWSKRVRHPPGTTRECSPISSVRWAGWWSKPPQPSPVRF